jgi:hypothetical protein
LATRGIVTPADIGREGERLEEREGRASILHDYTHGINSDPLTLLPLYSLLGFTIPPPWCPNVQLQRDETMAALYKNKSVAEQNSLDIAWAVLMSEEFEELRATLFATRIGSFRFRQVIVNIVLPLTF